MIKKFLVIVSLLVLSACATAPDVLTFDNNEYSSFVELKILTDTAIPNCPTPQLIADYSKLAKTKVEYLKVYTKYRYGNEKLASATNDLASMIDELDVRYSNLRTPPSTQYCTTKLLHIGAGTTTILATIGRFN